MIEENSEELDGKYMRITVGDDEGKEIIVYGVMSMIHWDKGGFGGKPYISFSPDQQHPSNGNPYNYPFAILSPLEHLIAYEFIPAETEYGQFMVERAKDYKIGFREQMKRRRNK